MNPVILAAKGGVMLFTVERANRVYKGAVLLSPATEGQRTRIVCMKVYKYKEVCDETSI